MTLKTLAMVRSIVTCLILLVCSEIRAQEGQIIGMGHTEGVIVTSSDSDSDPYSTLQRSGYLPNHNAASKLLAQSTFGANFELIEEVAMKGFEDWIDEQLSLPISMSLQAQVREYHDFRRDNSGNPDAGAGGHFWDNAWWQYHMSQPDLLRQRVAFALSEILVISMNSSFGDSPYPLSSYYDILLKHSFGNYRDLLHDVTYHAAMGAYLTYLSNPKTNVEENTFPDENYAREVMQLFTIGLFELNPDGTRQLDGSGEPIPTYDNEDIIEFSKIFTGLMYGDNVVVHPWHFFRGATADTSYTLPMQMYNEQHEPGVKNLLRGVQVPDRNPVDGDADISDALDNLYEHPNVGPFIGYKLIQRLVTSNPSPEYIARVTAAFDDNGDGVRGDMKSVIKAILLDEEARDCAMASDDHYGHLREPFIRYVQLNKAFDLSTASGRYRNAMYDVQMILQQKPFTSPSVFNFFQPDHQPIGDIADENLVAPEFQIVNTQTLAAYLNGLNQWIVRDSPTDEWGFYSDEEVPDNERDFFDLSDEIALASDDYLHQLVDRLNLILAQGRISDHNADTIIRALKEFPSRDQDDLEERVRIAIYLVMSAPEYLINR